MARIAFVSLILTIFCTFACAAPKDAPKVDTPCSPGAFVRIEGCCNMPKVVQADTYKACIGELPTSPKTGKTKKISDGLFEAFKSVGGTRGGKDGPMCLISCFLEKLNLLTAGGDADQDKIKAKYMAVSDAIWKPIVTLALANCSAELASIDTSTAAILAPSGKICKPQPALFATCVRHHLALNCPTSLLTASGVDESCPKKIQKLRECNPMGMKNSQFPLLRAYKLRKNPNKNKTMTATTPKKG